MDMRVLDGFSRSSARFYYARLEVWVSDTDLVPRSSVQIADRV